MVMPSDLKSREKSPGFFEWQMAKVPLFRVAGSPRCGGSPRLWILIV